MELEYRYEVINIELYEHHFYALHIKHDIFFNRIDFEVYPLIQYWESTHPGPYKLAYTEIYKHITYEVFDKSKVEMHFEGLFRYPGVWDEVIHFPCDNEYSATDIINWSLLWTKHIRPILRDKIKSIQPDINYDE